MWWISALFHIETLFALFVLWCLWFIYFYRDKHSDASSRLRHLFETFHSISSGEDYDQTASFSNSRRQNRHRAVPNQKQSEEKQAKKKYKSEERCREIFEGLFDKEFASIRPDWLKSPQTGMNLELDGYCPDIKTPLGMGLAFEYDGQQHARYTPRFHDSPKSFVNQCKRDIWKDKKCKERGVLVIRIPHTVLYQDLDMYIVKELGRYHLI